MKRIINLALLAFVAIGVNAQQNSEYVQYMYNTMNINPAYAGSRETLSVFGSHRQQWVGLEGAPKTTNFSVNTPIKNTKLGLGVSFVNDELGIMKDNTIAVDLSYTIDLDNRDKKLSFGIKGSANMLSVAYSDLQIYNPTDPFFRDDINNQFSPNIGAGVYYHTQKGYVGFSVPNFLQTQHFDGNTYAELQTRMQYYLMGGYIFELNRDLQFKPAVLLNVISGAPLNLDVNANFLIHNKITLGAAYRWDAQWSALAGFQITDGLMIGYAYDGNTTKLANYNSGSHEVFLRFELFNKYKKPFSNKFF